MKLLYTDDIKAAKKQLSRLDQDYKKISTQLDNTFDLVEQGVYTLDMFQTRRMKLTTQLDELDAQRIERKEFIAQPEASQQQKANLIPQTEELLASYDHMTNTERNELLKVILEKIDYYKGADGEIVIDLYPRLPKI